MKGKTMINTIYEIPIIKSQEDYEKFRHELQNDIEHITSCCFETTALGVEIGKAVLNYYKPKYSKSSIKATRLGFNKINGSHLQGCISCTYAHLVNTFGQPHQDAPSSDDKVDVEWSFEFNDGTVATIYNYKDGFAYLGKEGTPTEKITDWHVGGRDKKSLEYINKLLAA